MVVRAEAEEAMAVPAAVEATAAPVEAPETSV